VATGAAAAQARAEADQQAGCDQPWQRKAHTRRGHAAAEGKPRRRTTDQPDEEREPPAAAFMVLDHVVDDAADPGDAPDRGQQQGRGEPDQRAAEQCSNRGEFGGHGPSLRACRRAA
jgi:hypothetical protein